MMNDPRVPHDPLLHATRTLSWPYRRPPLANALSSAPSSLPPFTPFHHDTPSPLAFPQPRRRTASLRWISLASSFSPPARSFYFSFIFPTREPSRCNLHPSCCCYRRPSRLPRATTGVEADDSPPGGGKLFIRRKEISGNSIANVNTNRPIILLAMKWKERKIDSARCSLINDRYREINAK